MLWPQADLDEERCTARDDASATQYRTTRPAEHRDGAAPAAVTCPTPARRGDVTAAGRSGTVQRPPARATQTVRPGGRGNSRGARPSPRGPTASARAHRQETR